MNRSFILPITWFILVGFLPSCSPKEDEHANIRALLGSGLGIANATLIVHDLDSARKYFADVLGFTMTAPEKFRNGFYPGTRSALAEFPDGSALELLGVKDSALVSKEFSFINSYLKHHEGVRLYSLSTSSADTTYRWLSSRGFRMDSLRSGRTSTETGKGWDWDDGGPEWRSVELNNVDPPAYLPVFTELMGMPYREIQAEWESIHTSWFRTYNNHPNGVVGMRIMRVAVDDLDAARREFKKMGLTELPAGDLKNVSRFRIIHRQELHVVAPQSPGDSLANLLNSRGPGVFALQFEVKNLRDTREVLLKKLPAAAVVMDTLSQQLTVLKEHAHGVQLEFVEEPREQASMAQVYNFDKDTKLDTASIRHASGLYTKYCALCHGDDRQGYAADFAPSLRSRSLMATTQSSNYLKHAVSYGRQGTAMAAYARSQGGPLDEADIDLMLQWLYEASGVEKPVELSTESITGDVALGKTLYGKNCATCHGIKGEGVSAPALGNPMLLATASDAFLRYAISEGRDSTPMRSFKGDLSKSEMDALTAYLRSRASGWNAPEAVAVTEPLPEDYVLNPRNSTPKFALRKDQFMSAEQLLKALQDSSRMVILDARSKAAWHQSHIPGAVSVPYYEEPDVFIKHIPKDSTWIVAYCACPHAASQRVVNTLKRFGYKHTAILDEGILVWAQRGYPVQFGLDKKGTK